ncbi:MAG: Co2+/Mg2+ efflux protein ApaG [Pseudomonadota bacterium]
MYNQTTRAIHVSAKPFFLDSESSPEDGRYFWAYTIAIENRGGETVQLLTRYWRITDAQGNVQEVRGDGVVGEQPVLEPGGRFEYTSGAPLATPSGFMVGSYNMRSSSGDRFDVDIPAFSLDSPHVTGAVH